MMKFFYSLASPRTCYRWAGCCLPFVICLMLISLIAGLIGGLWFAPADYQQGQVYRIMFIHVPAASWSLGIYVLMSIAALVYLIWKIKIADIILALSAPIGMSFTLLALITGSIWGEPTWGTWWIWDARLTSELILLFIYAGIIALRNAIPEPPLASQVSGVLTVVGVVNIPIIHYSVNWWQTLHQGATLLKLGAPSISPSMLFPLLAMLTAFFLYYCSVLLIGLRYELLRRERAAGWVQEAVRGTRPPAG